MLVVYKFLCIICTLNGKFNFLINEVVRSIKGFFGCRKKNNYFRKCMVSILKYFFKK